jgi:hypothetical protein
MRQAPIARVLRAINDNRKTENEEEPWMFAPLSQPPPENRWK